MLVTFATVLMFSAIMSLVMQFERQESYENEVRMQAREVAEYMAHLNQLNYVRENTTMQYIVRRKLEDDPSQPRFLKNVWGKGYIFDPEGKDSTVQH